MATRRARKARRHRGRSSSRKTRPEEHVYGVPVPESLHEAIELERENLSKVESILACMVGSMQHNVDPCSAPYYPDVAQVARELVERSINGLDPFVLKQRLLNKVEEEFCTAFADRVYPLLH